jgi:DNA recombination protein RmuC
MNVMSIITLACVVVSSIAVLSLWLRSPVGVKLQLASLDARLTEIDRLLHLQDATPLHVRETKEAVITLSQTLGEMKGRLISAAETRHGFGVLLETLRSSVPLQIADGLRLVSESVSNEGATARKESSERDDRHSLAILAKIHSGSTALTDAVAQMRRDTATELHSASETLAANVEALRQATDGKLTEIVTRTTESARSLNETAQSTISAVASGLAELKSAVDGALKTELGAIRTESSAKLEAIRLTVDEKLHATLEQRLGDSFKLVSERLEQVHRGIGEMQSLATGVGDLRKVLTNIKTRGTWGEVQLGALLDQVLTQDQYAKNICTRPGSSSRVEFAIRLPGRTEDFTVWLPIDAKFPMEDYQKLVDAQERADVAGIEDAGRALEARIKLEARAVRDKYVEPPHTTDFAVLYLPTEGLYAEVLRRPGLSDWMQRECKVVLTGPTTLAALLNSLQMGFRTLAIEKRSSEVWAVLSSVKSEFGKFGDALAHTKKKLEEASSSIESAQTRNRVLTRKLKDVDTVPKLASTTILVPLIESAVATAGNME